MKMIYEDLPFAVKTLMTFSRAHSRVRALFIYGGYVRNDENYDDLDLLMLHEDMGDDDLKHLKSLTSELDEDIDLKLFNGPADRLHSWVQTIYNGEEIQHDCRGTFVGAGFFHNARLLYHRDKSKEEEVKYSEERVPAVR